MSSITIRKLQIQSDLKSTTKAILGALLSYCHNKDTCYPSVRDISQVWGYAESTIRKHIRILEKLEFIETTKGNKSRKSNNYKILKLNSVQKDPNATRRQRNRPEGLLENSYGPTGGRFDKKNPPKALSICDLDQSDGDQSSIAPKRVEESESQSSIAPKRVEESESQSSIAPKRVEESKSQSSIAPKRVEESESQKKPVRFEGKLTTQKIVELYNLYTRHGWIKRCYDSFFTFVANCLMIKRLRKKNVYGYLTWVYKKKFDRKLITAKDEELAKRELKLIQDNGLMPDLMEPQPPLQRDNPEAPVPPPPPPAPTRSTSRPAIDWHIKNLPEVGKEAALAKKVEHRQVTHINPSWMQDMNCWIVKVKRIDGRRFYEKQDLTPDGWFEVTGMTQIVPLIDEKNRRVLQQDFIQILASGFFAPDPTLPAAPCSTLGLA